MDKSSPSDTKKSSPLKEETNKAPSVQIFTMPDRKKIETKELVDILYEHVRDFSRFDEFKKFVELIEEFSEKCSKNNFRIKCTVLSEPNEAEKKSISLSVDMGPFADGEVKEELDPGGAIVVPPIPNLTNNLSSSTLSNNGTGLRQRHKSEGAQILNPTPTPNPQLDQLIRLAQSSHDPTTQNLVQQLLSDMENRNGHSAFQNEATVLPQITLKPPASTLALNGHSNPGFSLGSSTSAVSSHFSNALNRDVSFDVNGQPIQILSSNNNNTNNNNYNNNTNNLNSFITVNSSSDLGITHIPAMIEQDWHSGVMPEVRNHVIGKILKTICPDFNFTHAQEQVGEKLIDFSKKIESQAFDNSQDKEEYYHRLSEQIHKIRLELDKQNKQNMKNGELSSQNGGSPERLNPHQVNPVNHRSASHQVQLIPSSSSFSPVVSRPIVIQNVVPSAPLNHVERQTLNPVVKLQNRGGEIINVNVAEVIGSGNSNGHSPVENHLSRPLEVIISPKNNNSNNNNSSSPKTSPANSSGKRSALKLKSAQDFQEEAEQELQLKKRIKLEDLPVSPEEAKKLSPLGQARRSEESFKEFSSPGSASSRVRVGQT